MIIWSPKPTEPNPATVRTFLLKCYSVVCVRCPVFPRRIKNLALGSGGYTYTETCQIVCHNAHNMWVKVKCSATFNYLIALSDREINLVEMRVPCCLHVCSVWVITFTLIATSQTLKIGCNEIRFRVLFLSVFARAAKHFETFIVCVPIKVKMCCFIIAWERTSDTVALASQQALERS